MSVKRTQAAAMLSMPPACSTATHSTHHHVLLIGRQAWAMLQPPKALKSLCDELQPLQAGQGALTCDAGVGCRHAPEAPVRLPAIFCEHAFQHEDSRCQHLQVRSNHLTGARRLLHTAKWRCQEPQWGLV